MHAAFRDRLHCTDRCRRDIDKSGFLETAEIGRVVAKYNDEDWDNWDAAQRDAYLRKFMEWFDSEGTADRRLDKTEFIRYVVTEAIVRNPEDPDGSVGAIVKKFTDIIQDSRISDLFVLWDKDKSGQLDSTELNTVISKFNDQDSEEWDRCGFPLSGDEKANLASTQALIDKYDTNESDSQLNLEEFKLYVLDSTISENLDAPGAEFNRLIVMFTKILTVA